MRERPHEQRGKRCVGYKADHWLIGPPDPHVVFLALQPEPLIRTRGAVAFGLQPSGYVVVGEIRVEMLPGLRQAPAGEEGESRHHHHPFGRLQNGIAPA